MKAVFPPGTLPDGIEDQIEQFYRKPPFSIFWEVRTLLYLGAFSLSSGLGIIAYKNIDTVGHQAILALIAALTAACFWYCAKKAEPFTRRQSQASSWRDYVLLLGVLLFGVFVGYLQFQYSVFGSHQSVAFGIPAVFYLLLAYRFDHRGVLQFGISGLCAAVGIVVAPWAELNENLFRNPTPVFAGLGMGAALALAGMLSERFDFKRHFGFSYINFATHLSMLAALTGMMTGSALEEGIYLLLIAGFVAGLWKHAKRERSHYFLLVATVYGYVAFTYACLHLLIKSMSLETVTLVFLYFLVSCAATIYFFLNMKTFLGSEDAGLPKK